MRERWRAPRIEEAEERADDAVALGGERHVARVVAGAARRDLLACHGVLPGGVDQIRRGQELGAEGEGSGKEEGGKTHGGETRAYTGSRHFANRSSFPSCTL